MTAVDRRTFLKRVVAASAATATSAAVSTATAKEPSALAQPVDASATNPVWKKAPCVMCGVGCGLLVGIEGGRAVAAKGDPASSVGDGLACAKGYYAVQALYGRDRLKRARIARGAAPVDAPIGEALDLVATRLRDTIAQHGPDSVAMYGSSQWTIPDAYVAAKLFKGAIGTNNIDTSTRLTAAAAMTGLESTFGMDGAPGCYDDIEHADVIVLWDVNLAESDPVLFSRMLAHRSRNPAVRIIDVSSRTTRTSYAADQTIVHAPRATQSIANAICQDIVAKQQMHRAFVDRYVSFKRGASGLGYDLTNDQLVAESAVSATWDDYVASLADTTPDHVQQTFGVPAARIQWLASLFADRTRTVMSVWGDNVNRQVRGTYANNALYNVHLLVGKIATPGNTALSLTGQPNGGSVMHDAGSLAPSLPRGLVFNAADRQRAATMWGVPVQRISAKPARTAMALFRAVERGEIRFLWIQGTDPMVNVPGFERYRRAMQQRGCFVVVSDVYPTATTAIADVVLPSALWFEREGITGNAERRLQHFDLMTPPPGDAMSEAWQMIEVARRLGHGALFPSERRGHVERVWDEYRRFHEEPPSAAGSASHSTAHTSLPTFSALKATTGQCWPVIAGQETLRRYNTALDPSADRARGAYDFYGHADGRAWIWLRPNDPPAESPSAAYPLWLSTGPSLEHSGTGALTQRIPVLHDALPHAYVEMHHDDATHAGIRDRDLVRVTSKRGSIDLEARIDFRSQTPRGQLFVPTFDAERPVARLMLEACCPLSGQPDTTLCAVRIARVAVAGDR